MQIFNRSKPRDVLFLMPVRMKGEKPSRTRVTMLYCDADGRVYASPISRSAYETARVNTASRQKRNQAFATVGIETSPGDFLPTVIEINEQELWALDHSVEHALRTGRLPDILKRYLKSIIRRGTAYREAIIAEYKQDKTKTRSRVTPKVLNRLPYYRKRDMEISLPIYKAEHSYPLIILKFLPNKNEVKNQKNLLVLDSDGDLAAIRVPEGLVRGVEKKLEGNKADSRHYVCAVIYQQGRGRKIDYMAISQGQKNALKTITSYYEASGNGKHTVPAAARTVISLAGKRMTPEVR
jgi:hypothetical protein